MKLGIIILLCCGLGCSTAKQREARYERRAEEIVEQIPRYTWTEKSLDAFKICIEAYKKGSSDECLDFLQTAVAKINLQYPDMNEQMVLRVFAAQKDDYVKMIIDNYSDLARGMTTKAINKFGLYAQYYENLARISSTLGIMDALRRREVGSDARMAAAFGAAAGALQTIDINNRLDRIENNTRRLNSTGGINPY